MFITATNIVDNNDSFDAKQKTEYYVDQAIDHANRYEAPDAGTCVNQLGFPFSGDEDYFPQLADFEEIHPDAIFIGDRIIYTRPHKDVPSSWLSYGSPGNRKCVQAVISEISRSKVN
jgi:hypothetical protein